MKKVIKFLKYGVSAIFIIIFLTLSNINPYKEHFNFSYFNSQLNYNDSYLWVVFSITIILYILLSYDLFIKSFKAIKNKDFFNENTLMVLASIGALVIGELSEGLAVILLYKIGEEFEDYEEPQQTITDNLIDKFEVESLPQIEARLNPELDKLKTDLTDTIMADPSEAAKILISYIKD